MNVQFGGEISSGVAAGVDGSATSTGQSEVAIRGKVIAVHLAFDDSPPANTEVLVKTSGDNVPEITLVDFTDVLTDGWYFVRAPAVDTQNGAITNSHVPIPIYDKIKVTIDKANAGDSVTVNLMME